MTTLTPTPASGRSEPWSIRLVAATSCPTYAYSGTTMPCSTTTTSVSSATVAGAGAGLKAGYSDGKLIVTACGFTSAASGHNAQLYENGNPVGATSGGVATIDASGCASFTASVCLGQDTYQLAVIDQTPVQGGTAEVTGEVSVDAGAACRVAATAAGAGGLNASGSASRASSASNGGSGSSLAFTGTNVAWACLIGVALIMVGYLIVRKSRWHKRRRRYRYMRLQ